MFKLLIFFLTAMFIKKSRVFKFWGFFILYYYS